MTAELPQQTRRCTVFSWCTGHLGAREYEHHGKVHVVPACDGRELRLALCASGEGTPRITIEAVLAEGGQPLEVVELEPAEVVQAAATLRHLVIQSQQRVDGPVSDSS